jgi:UTP--glucose-1-phosphate uridylyltransferase
VWCARHLIGDEPFAVILPDDVIDAEPSCLAQMTEAHAETGGSVVAAMEVPPAKASSYGILDVEDGGGPSLRVRGMVEKPQPQDAPSNLAVIGRYILSPAVMGHLEGIDRGAGGELQLTDAIAKEIEGGAPVHGFRFNGQRYDCGSKAGFLQATVAFGLARDDLSAELEAFLRDVLAMREAAQ